jgi:molecular chaperone GrpE
MNDDTKKQQDELKEQAEEVIEKSEEEEFTNLKNLALQLDNQLKRSLADYQNLQRRTKEEKGTWIRSANRDLILKFLPILDTLFLAQKHLQDKGLELGIDQFIKLLDQEGVKRIETVEKDFDPMTMEAVSTMVGQKGKVLEESRAGYMLYDTIIRSAQVIVGA